LLYRLCMTRVLLLGLALFVAACGNKTFPSLCANSVPAPDGCNVACSPTPGAPAACAPGLHCSPDGKCDLVCTQGGTECGDDHFCTADGQCLPKDGPGVPDASTCPAVHVRASPTIPTVELLLDQSGSMTEDYGNTNRWDAMVASLINPTNGVVTRMANQVAFGATLYSSDSDELGDTDIGKDPCPTLTRPTPSARALNNLGPIRTLLENSDPFEDTPTAESIDKVVADFAANPPMTGSPPIIVLATDGLPDLCADANPPNSTRQQAANNVTVQAAQRAFAAGIKLYFLFVGEADEAGNHPQQMANAGAGLPIATGNADFYEATNPAQLAAAFNQIIGGVLSCDLRLDSRVDPADVSTGIVTVNGTRLVFERDWTLDADGQTLHIVGSACDMLKTTPNATVDAEFACGTIIF
jgi:hypothetical protein